MITKLFKFGFQSYNDTTLHQCTFLEGILNPETKQDSFQSFEFCIGHIYANLIQDSPLNGIVAKEEPFTDFN